MGVNEICTGLESDGPRFKSGSTTYLLYASVWISAETDPETRMQMQVVHLGGKGNMVGEVKQVREGREWKVNHQAHYHSGQPELNPAGKPWLRHSQSCPGLPAATDCPEKKKKEKALMCRVCPFPWCKYSFLGRFHTDDLGERRTQPAFAHCGHEWE